MALSLHQMLAAADASVPLLTPGDLAELMRDGHVLIIDLRETNEVERSGKVKNAIHVPRGMLEFRADPGSPTYDVAFAPGKPIVLYCSSGGRAALSGMTLRDMGYMDVRRLGSFADWLEAGGEIVASSPPPMVSGGQQNADLAVNAAPGPLVPGEDLRVRQDRLLDEAVEETFPASDPISPKIIRGWEG